MASLREWLVLINNHCKIDELKPLELKSNVVRITKRIFFLDFNKFLF